MRILKKNILPIYIFSMLIIIPTIAFFLKNIYNENFLSYFDEISLLLSSPIAIKGFRYFFINKGRRYVLIFFMVYLLVSFFTGILRNLNFLQVFVQFFLELKIVILLLIPFGMSKDQLSWFLGRYIKFCKLVIVLSIPIIVWQFLSPSLYYSIFRYSADTGVFFLPSGTPIPRGSGIFWFTGQLALFSGLSFLYFYFQYTLNNRRFTLIWIFLSILVLFLTFSRLEIAGTFLSLLFVLFLYRYGNSKKIIILFSLSIVLIIFWDGISALFISAISENQLNEISRSIAPRTVFYFVAFLIANQYFPFGSGLGSYGGQASVIFDSYIYNSYDFEKFWWYRSKVALTDTFWPHILGESGYVGLVLFVLFIVILYRLIRVDIFKTTNNARRRAIGYVAISGFILYLINSLASPNYYDVLSMAPLFVFIASTQKGASI